MSTVRGTLDCRSGQTCRINFLRAGQARQCTWDGGDILVSIGIPRALLYYLHFPHWRRFLQELGFKVILSPPTTARILNQGAAVTVDEVCAPVKVFFGHVLELRDQADCILVPRYVSVERGAYICPKLMGLPDMLTHSQARLPPLFSPNIDLRRGTFALLSPMLEAGRFLSRSAWPIVRAYYRSRQEGRRLERQLLTGLTPEEAFHGLKYRRTPGRRLRIALLGHAYNVYDPTLSMNLADHLRALDIDVCTAEMLPAEKVAWGLACIGGKELFWTLSRRVLGAGMYYLRHPHEVDGMITLSSFGCGLESLVGDLMARAARREQFPFMLLNIDEHSGEAGLVTRVEAFVDMIRGRGTDARNIPAHGDARARVAGAT